MQAKISTQPSEQERNRVFDLKWEKAQVISISPSASLKEAAQLMKENQVGYLLVLSKESGNELQGVVTDRDLALCLADDRELSNVTIADIMSTNVICASERDDLLKLIGLMHQNKVGRIPLQDSASNFVGVVTSKNIIEILAKSLIDLTQLSTEHGSDQQLH